jgi:uncharacterized repeat protein (TIGR03803 family)
MGSRYLPIDGDGVRRVAAVTPGYQTLHSFDPSAAMYRYGYFPAAGLISVRGALYGTIPYSKQTGTAVPGTGVAFSMTTTGTETMLHEFGSGNDGATPLGDLIYTNGSFYGTTEYGGKGDHGTVFALSSTGAERVLYEFGSGTDGRAPEAGVVILGGILYGTTDLGGLGMGTVYSFKSGHEQVLHRFGKGADGQYPAASLIALNGTLYGTTQYGGDSRNGTVFSITTAGAERPIYSFKSGADGARPAARLTTMGGMLYGTTQYGGTYGGGTVFVLKPGGGEKVLHSFGASYTDGREPLAGLVAVNGTLYGTTSVGGAYDHVYGGGGTLFSVTKTGVEKIVHSFGSLGDGLRPLSDLLNLSGTLYGTTEYGGANGAGTVFSLKI